MLSVLRYTDSDYPFCIFKPYFTPPPPPKFLPIFVRFRPSQVILFAHETKIRLFLFSQQYRSHCFIFVIDIHYHSPLYHQRTNYKADESLRVCYLGTFHFEPIHKYSYIVVYGLRCFVSLQGKYVWHAQYFCQSEQWGFVNWNINKMHNTIYRTVGTCNILPNIKVHTIDILNAYNLDLIRKTYNFGFSTCE
jgi:hypothetical protein